MGYCLASGRAAGHWAAALLRQAWAHPTGVHPGRPSSAWRASIPTPQMARIPDPAGPGGPQGRPDAGPQARRTPLIRRGCRAAGRPGEPGWRSDS
jgi:hypothetical protein